MRGVGSGWQEQPWRRYPGGSDMAGMDGWIEAVMQGMEVN